MPRGRQPLLKQTGEPLTSGENEQIAELLALGYRYNEIAAKFDLLPKQVSGQNYWRYKVNATSAFKERVNREGIQSRLAVDDAFGYWFAGLFDGEGYLKFHMPKGIPDGTQTANRWFELKAVVLMRADNNDALEYVHQYIGGAVYLNRDYPDVQRPNTKPRSIWQMHSVADLAEVLVPLFERYTLRTKKREELPLWKEAVTTIYANTMGGDSNRSVRDGFKGEEWERLWQIAICLKSIKRWEYH